MTNVALFVNGSFYDTEFDRDHDWRMAGELYDRQPSTSNWQNSFFIVYQYYGNISILLLTLVCGLFGRCHDHDHGTAASDSGHAALSESRLRSLCSLLLMLFSSLPMPLLLGLSTRPVSLIGAVARRRSMHA